MYKGDGKVSRVINKLIRKISGSELAQQQNESIIKGGKANEEIVPLLRRMAADGCVLLKNNGALPIKDEDNVALFGRVQNDSFFVGNGSGGDVCAPYKVSFADGIENNGKIHINEELKSIYGEWCRKSKNIPDPGFWGHWPRFYPEMPLKRDVVKRAADKSNKAVVFIGRSAGEDRENVLKKGSYYLTDREKEMLDLVTAHFDDVILILNIGSLIDFEEIESYKDKIGSILIVWQGGMESGNALSDILSGEVTPSGKLSDTIAKRYEDYPSSGNFGAKEHNNYVEDIFVGYRYFETFAPEKVLYEFGFGLSYTTFKAEVESADRADKKTTFTVKVTNTGKLPGKETVQFYVSAPNGKLGKAKKSLVAFHKTELLAVGESETFETVISDESFASYDDSGKTGHKSRYILESGVYDIYVGNSVRKCEKAYSFTLESTVITAELSEVMAVSECRAFERFAAVCDGDKIALSKEKVPVRTVDLKDRILSSLPDGKEISGDKGYKLSDVKSGKVKLQDFTAQLSLEELEAISRGEGPMNSSLGAKGNAGALGGVLESLRAKGIPPIITTDGPSGIRLLSACSLMPCGTAIACSWDEKLTEELFTEMGKEMIKKGSDVLLAPGMNIHRNVLCGRNFEYYSEDPYLTGKTAAATVRGIQKNGVSACPKHFAGNNQEYNRNHTDDIVSERALREIYLKGFEICVKESSPHCIMTSYNKINGVWSHYNYELCTTVLRDEWHFGGMVMTDWWMRYAPSPEFPQMRDNAYRVRAQVDVLMPGFKTAVSKSGGNDGSLLETYGQKDGITLGELQRTANNVLRFILSTDKKLD